MPVPGNTMTPIGSDVEHGVVALERGGLGVLRPVGLEGDLRHLAVGRPFGGDQLGALRGAAVQQHHVGMLGVDLVESVPDQAMIVEVEAAGDGDLWTGGQEHLVVGALLRGEEIAAVDHGRRQRAMVDLRSRARPPGRAGVAFELVGGLVAKELHAVPALDQRDALGRQALEFDGPYLGAILLLLAAQLRLLVVVEFALDAVDGAVEEIDGRPEQVVEVGFEARVAQGRDQGVEDVGDGACDGVAFGKRPRIGLVVEGAVAVELKLAEEAIGRG